MPLKGASKTKYNTWRSVISIGNKQLCLGTFSTEEEAHNAYLLARLENPAPRKLPERTVGLPPDTPTGIIALPLTKGYWTLISSCDADLLVGTRLFACVTPNTVYAALVVEGKNTQLHRFLLNPDKFEDVDHINHNGLDNTRSNLRVCTRRQNQQNRRVRENTSSIYKGVSLTPCGKWRSKVTVDGVEHRLGNFETEKDAALAYDSAALLYFGAFAHTNFGKDGISCL